MHRLVNSVMPYAWGSTTALATLQRRTPTGAPEAELWLGAHDAAPSTADGAPLHTVIQTAALECLGPTTHARFGPRLPFLLKVLAAAQPLSLQAHPTLAQARAGFEREEAAGTPKSAPHRNYKDANHKPELICALTPFVALCGFREAKETWALLEALNVERLSRQLALHAPNKEGLEALFRWAMTLPKDGAVELATAIAQAVRGAASAELQLAERLAAQYPNDVGVLGALLLNLVTLQPGEALYLPAGNLHAYVEGVGVEIMASSDNVLRGGLTPKHVDVTELLAVLDFSNGPVSIVRPRGEVEQVYETPAPEFRLSRVVANGAPVSLTRWSADIFLCTEGHATLACGQKTLSLQQGESAFVRASDGPCVVNGSGVVFRATVNE